MDRTQSKWQAMVGALWRMHEKVIGLGRLLLLALPFFQHFPHFDCRADMIVMSAMIGARKQNARAKRTELSVVIPA